jgi:hypothetical protein
MEYNSHCDKLLQLHHMSQVTKTGNMEQEHSCNGGLERLV